MLSDGKLIITSQCPSDCVDTRETGIVFDSAAVLRLENEAAKEAELARAQAKLSAREAAPNHRTEAAKRRAAEAERRAQIAEQAAAAAKTAAEASRRRARETLEAQERCNATVLRCDAHDTLAHFDGLTAGADGKMYRIFSHEMHDRQGREVAKHRFLVPACE